MIKLKVKPFQEALHGGYCGPASFKIVLGYYGVKESEKNLAKIMRRNKELGTKLKDFARAANKFGLKFSLKDKASFSDIEKCLKKGVPPIVNWFTRRRSDYPDS